MARSNLSLEKWRGVETEFLAKVASGGVAVVYYSGYGLHEGTENWLLPVNFDPGDSRTLSVRAYSVIRLRQLLEEKGVRLKILFLNAGRAVRVLESFGHQPGLAPPVVDPQTIACLASPPAQTQDVERTEKTSPFARILAGTLVHPGAGLQQLFGPDLSKTADALGMRADRPVIFMQSPPDFRFAQSQ